MSGTQEGLDQVVEGLLIWMIGCKEHWLKGPKEHWTARRTRGRGEISDTQVMVMAALGPRLADTNTEAA